VLSYAEGGDPRGRNHARRRGAHKRQVEDASFSEKRCESGSPGMACGMRSCGRWGAQHSRRDSSPASREHDPEQWDRVPRVAVTTIAASLATARQAHCARIRMTLLGEE